MFMELYYKNYRQLYCEGYREEPVSLPFSVRICSENRRAAFEHILRSDGFRCVVGENGSPCMYVNFTLKRYGRNVKACASSSINAQPLTEEEFTREVYLPWRQDPNRKAVLENNFVLSAQIMLQSTKKLLEENIRSGCASADLISWAEAQIGVYELYLAKNAVV